MARVDRIKEEIGWLKVVFTVCVALDASLIAWLAHNYSTATDVLVLLTGAAILVVTVVIIGLNHIALHRIREMEDL